MVQLSRVIASIAITEHTKNWNFHYKYIIWKSPEYHAWISYSKVVGKKSDPYQSHCSRYFKPVNAWNHLLKLKYIYILFPRISVKCPKLPIETETKILKNLAREKTDLFIPPAFVRSKLLFLWVCLHFIIICTYSFKDGMAGINNVRIADIVSVSFSREKWTRHIFDITLAKKPRFFFKCACQ